MKNNLKQLREEAGLTQEELRLACNLRGGGTITNYENKLKCPTLRTAYAISKVLGKSVYDIWPDMTKVTEKIITVRCVVTEPSME